jgi:hypothetical protein
VASIGLRINQPAGFGVDTGVADVFAKALFGDPEAAAKVALAKAQIATQNAAATNYGATTAFTNSKTTQNEEELAARKHGVGSLAELMTSNLAPLVPTETPRPSPDFQGPGIIKVQPAAIERDRQIRHAIPGIAEAALVGGGGNAEQIMRSAGVGAGMTGLLAPTPETVRQSSTLYTGTAPNQGTVLMPGDTAGADQAIREQEAKPTADKVIKDKAGNSYTLSKDPTGKTVAEKIEGVDPVAPAGPFDGDSAEMHYNVIVDNYNRKKSSGEATTPDEDRQYAIADNALFGDKIELRQNDKGETYSVHVQRPRPEGLFVPGGSTGGGAANTPVVAAPPTTPSTLAPVPTIVQGPGPAPVPSIPLPAPSSPLSPLVGGRNPVPVGTAPAVSAPPAPAAPAAPVPVKPLVDPKAPKLLIPSTKTTVPLTEQAGRAASYYMESNGANRYLDTITVDKIPSITDKALSDQSREGITGDAARYLASDEAKTFQDNAQGFTNGYLRLQSGAVIRPEEQKTFEQRYIPQPGDSKERLEAKKIRREVVMMALKQVGTGSLPMDETGKASFAGIEGQLNALYGDKLVQASEAETGARSPKSPAAETPKADAPPAGVTQQEWDAMDPEDRKAFQ